MISEQAEALCMRCIDCAAVMNTLVQIGGFVGISILLWLCMLMLVFRTHRDVKAIRHICFSLAVRQCGTKLPAQRMHAGEGEPE